MHKGAKRGAQAAMGHAQSMRDRAVWIAMKRKEEYLGARVPKELKERVIAQASKQGIPVSLLIRRVLEEAFGEVDEPSPDVPEEKAGAKRYADVIGWKSVEMNRDHECSACGGAIKAGDTAAFGITTDSDRYVILCHRCKGLE